MFIDPQNIGFNVLLTNLLIFWILGGHLGRHLELQLFDPYLGVAPKFFLNLLGVLYKDQESKLRDIFCTQDPLSSRTNISVSNVTKEQNII